jgi:thioredoxin-related protein
MNLNLSFKKQLTLFAALVIFCSNSIKINAQINFQNYSGKLATDKVQLVVFCAGWCGNCKEMKKTVFQDKELSAFVNENFNAYMVDVDKDRSGISSKYNVSGLPAFVFVSEKGELLYKGVGYTETDEFLKKSQYSLKKASGKLTDRDRLYECMESEITKSCEELLKNYLQNNSWKSSEENAIAVIDYALNGNKTAINHLMQNKAEYSKVISKVLMERALLMLAEEEMHEMLVKAFEKKAEPDWKKVEQILIKYKGADNYITDLHGTKAAYYFELGNWTKFLSAKNDFIQSELNNKSGEEKGNELYQETKTLLEEIDNYEKKLTAVEEKQAAELVHKLLLDAEKLLSNPEAELYYELYNSAETLGLKEEDYFYRVYEKIKNGQKAADAKKASQAEIEAEED